MAGPAHVVLNMNHQETLGVGGRFTIYTSWKLHDTPGATQQAQVLRVGSEGLGFCFYGGQGWGVGFLGLILYLVNLKHNRGNLKERRGK